jgi:NADH-quinone oxidoreductase subunit J
MELTAILFYVFSMITLGSAIYMVFCKNIVHAAFALMFTLLGVAALYVLLFADFLAATQVLVYVGGILILILFGVMLTTQGFTSNLKALTSNLLPVSALMTLVAAGMVFVFYTSTWPAGAMEEPSGTITGLGMLLLHEYMLPFQMTGVLLLIAIIGALLMATRIKHQN